MNTKSLKKVLISVLVAFALLCATVGFMPKTKTTYADTNYTPAKAPMVLDKLGTYKYYYDSTGNMSDFAGVYVQTSVLAGDNTYKYDNDEIWSIATGANSNGGEPRNPNIYMYAEIPEHIRMASKNGYATLTANLQMKTAEGISSTIAWKKDPADKMYAKLMLGSPASAGTFNQNFTATVTENYVNNGFTDLNYKAVSINLYNLNGPYVMLHTYADHVYPGGWAITATSLYVKQPSFTLSSSDTTAPTVTFDANQNWSNQNKTLNVSISDTQAGIRTITYDGKDVTSSCGLSSDTKTGSYAVTLTENGTHTFVVTDNVGNSKTYTYTESKIDKVAPEVNVTIYKYYHNATIDFTADLSYTGAPTTFYYTVDGSMPDKNSYKLGETNSAEVPGNGDYLLLVKGYDEAGNESDVASYAFKVDDNIYTHRISSDHTAVNEITGYCGDKYTLTAEEGYQIYKVTIDGVDLGIVESGREYMIEGDAELEVVCRKIVTLSNETVYEYNENGFTPNYVISETGATLDLFDLVYTLNGEPTVIHNQGTYLLTYSIATEEYVGSGSFEVVILPKEITVSDVVTEYVYEGEFGFEYSISERNENISVGFTQNGLAVNPYMPGEYAYEFVSASDNYVINASGNFVIKKRTLVLTVSGISEFDGVEHTPEVSVSGMLGSDTVESEFIMTFNGGAVDKIFNAGDYNYTLTVKDNDFYDGSIAGTITVSKKAVTVTANNLTSVYGEDIKPLTYTVTGAVPTLPDFELNKADGFSAGTYDITIARQDLANFDVTYVDAKYVVSKKDVQVIATEGQYKYYGDEDRALTYSATGLVGSDVLDGDIAREEGESVGYYVINEGTLKNDNYNIIFADSVFKILQKQVVVKGSNVEKTYGETDPAIQVKTLYGALKEGDYVVATRDSGEDAGRYLIDTYVIYDANGEDVTANYVLIGVPSIMTIKKAPVTVTANAVSTVYGTSVELSYKTSKDVNFTGDIVREKGDTVGTYLISIGTLDNPNYDITFVSAYYVITPKTVYVTANSVSKVYGETETLTYSVEGLLTGDSLVGNLVREEGEDAGEYLIKVGTLENSNYVIEFTAGTLTINKKSVTVTVDDAQKIYGETDPELTYSIDGVLSGDIVDVTITREEGENVGEYIITVVGIDNDNYVLTDKVDGTLTIKKATVDFEVLAKTVTYNGEVQSIDPVDFEFEVTYKYLVYGVEVEPIDAGVYDVQVIFDGGQNYESVVKETTLTITKKRVNIFVYCDPIEYNGSAILPSYKLTEEISVMIEFEGDLSPVEKGEYKYVITADDGNRYVYYEGTLVIK